MSEEPVIIVDYDPRWPLLYEEEKVRIIRQLEHTVAAIEHIGSTAVLGLGAKPIIDIMVGLQRLSDSEKCVEALKAIGYQYRPDVEVSIPERRYCEKVSPEGHQYHLHMVERSSDFWKNHLLFRDLLRAHPQVAREYHGLKLALAVQYGSDREGLYRCKDTFYPIGTCKSQS